MPCSIYILQFLVFIVGENKLEQLMSSSVLQDEEESD